MRKLRTNLVTCPKLGWNERNCWIQACWFLVQDCFCDARISRASQAMKQLMRPRPGVACLPGESFLSRRVLLGSTNFQVGREPTGPFPVFQFPTFQPKLTDSQADSLSLLRLWACAESYMYIVSGPIKLGNVTHWTVQTVSCDLLWIYNEEKSRQEDKMCHHPIDSASQTLTCIWVTWRSC